MEKLLSKILEKIKKDSYLFQTWEDLLYMSKEAMKENIPLGVKYGNGTRPCRLAR